MRPRRLSRARPYGRYVSLPSARPEHRAWHGTVLPLDDPWWDTHAPPNGWGCRCKLQQLSDRDLERYGFEVNDKPSPSRTVAYVNERTGQMTRVPVGIDPASTSTPGRRRAASHPPTTRPVLTPVQNFRDLGRPTFNELVAAGGLPEAVDRWHGLSGLRDAGERWHQLFGKDSADIADPRGMQVTFSTRMLVHIMQDDKKGERASFVPRAKQAIEQPTEIWMVPFRRKDG